MPHVDDARLQAYLDGELRWLGEDPAELERHLERCAECRGRLEEVKRLREQGRALLGGQLPVDHPPFEAVLRRARAGSEHSAPRRRLPAGLWAASLVLALAGGWLARGMLGGSDAGAARDGVQLSRAPAAVRPTAEAPVDSSAAAPLAASAPAEPPRANEPSVEGAPPLDSAPTDVAVRVPLSARQADSVIQPPRLEARPPEERRTGIIQGRVLDESGRAIRGATVQVHELGVGTLTDEDGTYSLALPEERTAMTDSVFVRVAALGWEPATQPVSPGRETAVNRDFRLHPARVELEGIVAVGYGTATPALRARSEEWAPAERAEVQRILGREALRLAGLPVVETAVGWVDGRRSVKVRQELPGGAVATLLQWLDPVGDDAGPPAGETTAELRLRGAADEREAEAVRWREGVRVLASAPIPADSLEALLDERLR